METGLFWVQSRYYDPEVGRFISPDSIEYLAPESLNGLNLYAYCGNNPVMGYDPGGTSDIKWWQKLLIGVGLFIVGAAVTFFTAGMGTAGLAALGAFTVGFAKTAVVGMAIGGAIGAISGGISGGVQGAADGFGNGAADAFMFAGVGSAVSAVGGAIVKGVTYSSAVRTSNFDSLAKIYTHNKSATSVMIGKWDGGGATSYVAKAGKSHTYFQMPNRTYARLSSRFGVEGMWSINKAFLNQQFKLGKSFVLSHNAASATGIFLNELNYLKLLRIFF